MELGVSVIGEAVSPGVKVMVGIEVLVVNVPVTVNGGRSIKGVGLNIRGVGVGKGVAGIEGSGCTVQPLHPESMTTIERDTNPKRFKAAFSSCYILSVLTSIASRVCTAYRQPAQ